MRQLVLIAILALLAGPAAAQSGYTSDGTGFVSPFKNPNGTGFRNPYDNKSTYDREKEKSYTYEDDNSNDYNDPNKYWDYNSGKYKKCDDYSC